MAFVLVPLRELTSVQHGECGTPYLVKSERGLTTICSKFPLLSWPGRASYTGQRLQQRVVVYDGDRRVALHDTRYPINDLAFHPSAPELALATGEYDGGHYFEGELILWNWETGATRSVLSEPRQVVRCSYADANRLAILTMPHSDDTYPYEVYEGAVLERSAEQLDVARLEVVQPDAFGLPVDDPRPLRPIPMMRRRVWDLAWTRSGLLACTLEHTVELWDVTAGRRVAELVHAGTPAQLLRQPERLLVHYCSDNRSTLLEVRDDALVPWHVLPGAAACSVDASGRILARDVRHVRADRRDRVIARDGETLRETDLGHYDVFNHYLRVDHGHELYFLRGTPPERHERKLLCALDDAGDVHEVMRWDGDKEHLLTSVATLAGDDIVRAYIVYSPRGSSLGCIERCSLAGAVAWRHPVTAGATALCAWPAARAIAFALLDGTFGVLDIVTGAVLHRETPFLLDGASTIVNALAVHDETIVLGTIQGRLLLYALS